MNILLVVPRYNFTNEVSYHYSFPLGFAYISSVLKGAGYPVSILNLNHVSGEINKIVTDELDKNRYDVVCTGNTYLGLLLIQKMVHTIHEHQSKPTIILGGPMVTNEPEVMAKLLRPDFIILEEGEETVLELVSYLKDKKNYENIKGIGYFDANGEVKLTERRIQIENLDTLPYPDFQGLGYEEWLDDQCTNDVYNGIVDDPRPYPILGSRGCAYACTFCYHFNSKYKLRSIESLIAELRQNIKKYRINIITLYDDLFSANKSRIYDFCNKIKELRNELTWDLKWGCQLAVNVIDKELITTLRDSGCCWISFGFESMSQKVLNSMNKQFITPEQIKQTYFLSKEAKINVQGNFIFGDIAETKETAQETLENWKKHFAGQIYLTFVRPYPGSAIYEYCKKKEIIKDPMEFIKNLDILSENYYNFTESMSDEEFNKLKMTVLRYNIKYSKFVVPHL